jgi:cobalt/nickel transport system permease protein
MHISEGVLSPPVLAAGAVLAAAGTAVGLKKLDYDRVPQVAVLSAAFFVASLVHLPLGPASAHLVMNGLLGILLGWVVFPAILVALVLQAILFQFGGITTLGVNTVIMALPALVCFFIFGRGVRSERRTLSSVSAFLGGACAVLLGALTAALALVFTGDSFVAAAKLIVLAHLPVVVVEGLVTAFAVQFLKKVKPEILGGENAAQ